MFIPSRLDKYLRDSTLLSAPRARQAIRDGRVGVTVPSEISALLADAEHAEHAGATSSSWIGGHDFRLEPERIIYAEDEVRLDGKLVRPRTQHHYVVLNKPKGVTSTTACPTGQRDLSGYLAEMPEGVFPVGRLDRETTGLLLFTTDGDLSSMMLRPENHTDKLYWLWLDAEVRVGDERLARMLDGVPINGGLARAAAVDVARATEDFTELLVTLRSGLNRQIRKTCHALGLHLQHLHRLRVGSLSLDGVELGMWRALEREEGEALWDSVGGRERVWRRRIAALAREAMKAREREAPLLRLERWLTEHR